MARHSPVRFLAPLALMAAVVAVVLVVQSSRSGDPAGGGAPTSSQSTGASGSDSTRTTDDTTTTTPRRTRRTYTVKPGDILSTVSEQTGISVDRLQELNPDLDPQALQVGEKIKLAPNASTDAETP
jgi:LysM repeat protein